MVSVSAKVLVKVKVRDGEYESVARLRRELIHTEPVGINHSFAYFADSEKMEKLLQAINTRPVIEKIDELIETIENTIHEAETER